MSLNEMFQQALEAHRAGKLADAESLYRAILAQEPDHAQALHFLGVLHHQRGEHQSAVEMIERSLEKNPNNAEAHNNLGAVMTALGDAERAYRCYQIAIQLNPNYPEAQNNLGEVLMRAGRRREAIEHFGKALSLRPNYPAAWNGLGESLGGEGNTDKAAECFARAIALAPDFAAAHYNLAVAQRIRGELDAAVQTYRRAIELIPGYAQSHSNLSAILFAQGKQFEAIDHAHKAIELAPDEPAAYNNLANSLLAIGRHEEAIDSYRRTIELAPDDPGPHSNLLYALHFRPESRPNEIVEETATWNARHAARFSQSISPHANDRTPDRRLRIGYVSGDFRDHPVGQFMLPLMNGHDRTRFEIICYSEVARHDHVTTALASRASQWRDIALLSDEVLAEQIRADGIDILVDLSGHTAHNRLLVFARKPAPVQVSYLGYPDKTGLLTIEYFLADRIVDPSADPRIMNLASTWCYQPIDDSPEPAHANANDRPITFACFNNFAKVSEELIGIWARILDATPDSQLLIKAQPIADDATREAVHKHLVALGIPEDRVEVLPRTKSLRDHMAMYSTIDIALDTFPYHGTTTTCDALYMSVPVITLAGHRHVSLVGASLLASVGLTEFIADTPDEYVNRATHLAKNRALLAGLHSTLRERMTSSPLMNASEYVHDVESAYREMWRKWCNT